MPKIDIDMFEDSPKVGDKVKVTGEVESIDEDTGEVEVSYDDVSIVDKEKSKKRKKRRNGRDYFEEEVVVEDQVMPQSQTLDQALAQSFPNTQ